ncbi:hypothetical protein SAMN04488504_10289 [Myxococcus virescens]|uniref:Ribbon-helix-helix protein CopG domain-containing protein n=1 Tax=Myxococcus virescens TaxID=83456 RepID=A0ABY0MJ83_9BACT|nr:hypothetical protein SAMN04488504_10289 [Myxococcus virescens]
MPFHPTLPGVVPWQSKSGAVPCRAPTGEHALPRHDPTETPPEKRRAEKGSVVLKQLVRHTLQSAADLEALAKRWKCNEADAVRRALREAAERGE